MKKDRWRGVEERRRDSERKRVSQRLGKMTEKKMDRQRERETDKEGQTKTERKRNE